MRACLPIIVVFAGAFFSTEAALGQGTDRTTKVANELVELINAADYAGIQAKFNKKMDTALPLDKSRAFFVGLTQQMGKIEKLGEPQPVAGAPVFPAKFEKGTLDMQIVLDGRGLIAGLGIKCVFQKVVVTKDGKTETRPNCSPVKGEIVSLE